MAIFTCESYQAEPTGQSRRAPKSIKILGDKTKKTESAQHIIEFPGGAIELSRCENGDYWAHIILNRVQSIDDCDGLNQCTADVVDSRMDYEWPADPNVIPIPNKEHLHQIAVRIRPNRSAK
jgi:hypothetical protein